MIKKAAFPVKKQAYYFEYRLISS